MSFSYSNGSNPDIDNPRALVWDAAEENHVFEDEDIGVFRSIIRGNFSGSISDLRVAALMCDALASKKARLDLTKLQDANTDFHGSARELRAQADRYRAIDDETGAYAIVQQAHTGWQHRDMVWNQIQRESA